MIESGAARLSCRAIEDMICEIWSGYFGREVLPHDDFFDLGGDSLAMVDVVTRARECGLPVRSSVALRNSTPARLAESLTIHTAESSPVRLPALVRAAKVPGAPVNIVPVGQAEPLYVVHSDSHVAAEREAVEAWGGERPVRGFQLTSARSLDEIADQLLPVLRQTGGPYRLAGFGHGAVLAFELARRLRDQSAEVALLALVKPSATELSERSAGRDRLLEQRTMMLARRFGFSGDETLDDMHARMRADGWYDDGVRPQDLPWLQVVWVDITRAVRAYEFGDYDGPAVLFQDIMDAPATERTWSRAVKNLEIHWFDHGIESPLAMLRDVRLAQAMRRALGA